MVTTAAPGAVASRVTCRRRRRPTVRRTAAALTLLTGTVVLASCMNAEQQTVFDLVNAERAAAGRRGVAIDIYAKEKAQAWADHLAATNSLSHSNLTSGMDDGWTKLAENVGSGSSIEVVHEQFMRSSTHRANILDGTMTHLGTGVARAHGKVFVVQVLSSR